MQKGWMLFVLAFLPGPVFASDTINLKNITIDAKKAMETFGFDKSGDKYLFGPFYNRDYYLVQFSEAIQESWKSDLKKQGVELLSYIPDNAFIAKITTDQGWNAVNEFKKIQAVLPYEPSYKISGNFQAPSVFTASQPLKMMVKLTSPEALPVFLSAMKAQNVEVLGPFSQSGVIINSPVNKLQSFSEIEGVEWIEPYVEMEQLAPENMGNPSQPPLRGDYTDLTGYESGTKIMNMDAAWSLGLHGEGQVVGIADSGLDRGSTVNILDDFKGQVINGYIKGLFGNSWADPDGHGTHTAGSVVGNGANSGGKLKGSGYGAKLVEEGMWSPKLTRLAINPNFEDLFGSVFRMDGVRIHSNSWGGTKYLSAYDISAVTLDEVAWSHPDLLIVFAAGNLGADENKDGRIDAASLYTPSTAKNCLTVGSSKNLVVNGGYQFRLKDTPMGAQRWPMEPLASSRLSENPDGMAPFSSIGPTLDGRIKPDIVAPGTNIISTRSQVPGAEPLWGVYNNFYVYSGGTSMSTPLVAGAAAVTRQYLKRVNGKEPSAALVKGALIHGAHDMYPGQFGTGPQQELLTTRPNMNEGFGRVDMAAVVTVPYYFIDERAGLSMGNSSAYGLGLANVAVGQKIRATLTYTDAPGSPGAATALVNDLDLAVVDSKGGVHFPNHLNGPDKKNNVEMVEFDAPSSGAYFVVVLGTNVPKGIDGKQPYAVLWSIK